MKDFMKNFFTRKRIVTAIVWIVIAAVAVIFGESRVNQQAVEGDAPEKPDFVYVQPATPFLPDNEFQKVAESEALVLSVHPPTGHFHIMDNRSGQLYRSYPNPDHMEFETTGGAWINHIKSPVTLSAVNYEVKRDNAPLTSLLHDKGRIINFKPIENGFALTFDFIEKYIQVPIEVTLADDYVETRIVDEGIKEVGDFKIAELRVYPAFNAHHSLGQEGYLMIPDGSGALVNFVKNRSGLVSEYQERVYGVDWSFSNKMTFSNRHAIKMPVYGLKNETAAHLSVITEGDEYANVFAAPSGSYTNYNWITTSFIYRQRFFQPTSTDGEKGYYMYQRERLGTDRVVRTYILEPEDADYTGMAKKYRQHLINEYGLKQRTVKENAQVPLHVRFFGGDSNPGFLGFKSFIPLTTTDQAKEIVGTLHQLGINQMNVVYQGWQQGGNSSYGGNLPVDQRIGGESGMADFIQYANSLGFPVHLHAGLYGYNNTEKDGFRRRRDGLRDLSSTIIDFDSRTEGRVTFVSPGFITKSIGNDLNRLKKLGVNGLSYAWALGDYLNTDYNERYFANRSDVRKIQQSIAGEIVSEFGPGYAFSPNMYMLPYTEHIYTMPDDHSYDSFVDESVPFMQIALHGLVSYSSAPVNQREDYVNEFLRSIEYGSEPSFVLTYAGTEELLRTIGLRGFYSTYYKDWTTEMLKQYQLFNESLGHLQGQLITSHRTITEGVKETVYEGGTRVIVNYNRTPYRSGDVQVEAENFTVIKGGGA
ncbi:DUF5696 domain-containing protein [Paenibacillus tarimensis]